MTWSKYKDRDYSKYRNMFVDREEIIQLFEKEYSELKNNPDYFKVISIYGMGGIGKSYLVEKLLEIPQRENYDCKIITINMDIMNSADIFDNLVKVRKQLKENCLYFDYALIMLWDVYRIGKLDEDFMRRIKGNVLSVLNMIDSGLSSIYPTLGFENVLNLFRTNILPIAQKLSMNPEIFNEINNRFQRSPQQLYEFMPHLLGLDIEKISKKHRLIAFFDSYESYIIDHDDWLKELIGSIGYGLFLVASREQLDWSNDTKILQPYMLQELPQIHTKMLLKSSLAPKHHSLIPTIIEKTQCVPLYIELAISIYRKVANNNPSTVESEFWLIKEKSDFIKHFLRHLPNEDQEIVLILSVIRIFNPDIFEWIVHDLNLSYNVLKYHDLCKLCLVNLLKEDDRFLKLHDVFTTNALKFINYEKQKRILDSYITYVGNRGVMLFTQKQLTILFRNLLCISEYIDFSISNVEFLCDIFFVLYESHCSPELYKWVMNSNSKSLSAFRILVNIIYTEKENAKNSYNMSLGFTDSKLLGKHEKSFKLIQMYAKAISGSYGEFSHLTEQMYSALKSSDVFCWYYGKTKIYYADHLMLHGNFTDALLVFEEYIQELEHFPQKEGDYFEVQKQMAHCKRFNMFLDEAEKTYQRLADETSSKKGLQVYVLSNLCETNCYFHPDFVLKLAPEAMKLSDYLNRPKEKAKIYYSVAIANLHYGNYESAKSCIEKSMLLNKQAQYPSGVLFALMAKAYLEYAQYSKISSKTKLEIIKHIEKGQVYQFFKLPLSILEADFKTQKQIQNQFKWIDFEYTVQQYQNYLYLITHPKSKT